MLRTLFTNSTHWANKPTSRNGVL